MHIEHIFKGIPVLGKLYIIDVTLDIMRYYNIIDGRKFLVGSGDLAGIKKIDYLNL